MATSCSDWLSNYLQLKKHFINQHDSVINTYYDKNCFINTINPFIDKEQHNRRHIRDYQRSLTLQTIPKISTGLFGIARLPTGNNEISAGQI